MPNIYKKDAIVVLGIISVLVLAIFISGYTSSKNKISNVSSVNMTFENEAVKFNYPVNLKILNYSDQGTLDIKFYNGTTDDPYNEVGSMGCGYINGTSTKKRLSTWNNTTICGYPSLRGKNEEYSGFILFIKDNVALEVLFEPSYDAAANRIIDSLVIKKVPIYNIRYS